VDNYGLPHEVFLSFFCRGGRAESARCPATSTFYGHDPLNSRPAHPPSSSRRDAPTIAQRFNVGQPGTPKTEFVPKGRPRLLPQVAFVVRDSMFLEQRQELLLEGHLPSRFDRHQPNPHNARDSTEMAAPQVNARSS
jgi:hypothetical protein